MSALRRSFKSAYTVPAHTAVSKLFNTLVKAVEYLIYKTLGEHIISSVPYEFKSVFRIERLKIKKHLWCLTYHVADTAESRIEVVCNEGIAEIA